jgi:hypothetical protein
MPKRVITPEIEKEMAIMGRTMSAAQIAKELKLPYTTVHWHMNDKGMERRLNKKTRNRSKENRKPDATIFNVFERENWLV